MMLSSIRSELSFMFFPFCFLFCFFVHENNLIQINKLNPSFKLIVYGQQKVIRMGKMKEKRYIKRNPYSIEDGLKDVIEKIGEKGVKEATGKGKDTFLKKVILSIQVDILILKMQLI